MLILDKNPYPVKEVLRRMSVEGFDESHSSGSGKDGKTFGKSCKILSLISNHCLIRLLFEHCKLSPLQAQKLRQYFVGLHP